MKGEQDGNAREEWDGVFDNGVFVGGASLRFRGPFRLSPQRNRLEFTFDELRIRLGKWAPTWKWSGLSGRPDKPSKSTEKGLPFFTFFYVRDRIACARGRGGGLALYKKVEQGSEV